MIARGSFRDHHGIELAARVDRVQHELGGGHLGVDEVDRLGRVRGEVRGADRTRALAAATGDDVLDAVLRDHALVIVIVTGEHELHVVLLQHRRELGLQPGIRAVLARGVGRAVEIDDLPRLVGGGEIAIQPRDLGVVVRLRIERGEVHLTPVVRVPGVAGRAGEREHGAERRRIRGGVVLVVPRSGEERDRTE